jgi:CRP/FNR family transcriptional regulator
MASVPDALELLRHLQIFNSLTETELQFLAQRAVPRSYRKGEIVFTERDPCMGLFVIESGQVRIFKSSPGGREQILAVEGPGRLPGTYCHGRRYVTWRCWPGPAPGGIAF